MDKERFDRLPKYAQYEFEHQKQRIEQLERAILELQKAHELLTNPALDWFTIGIHTPEKRNLYFLDKDHANHIATIGAGSFIMIAHPSKLSVRPEIRRGMKQWSIQAG